MSKQQILEAIDAEIRAKLDDVKKLQSEIPSLDELLERIGKFLDDPDVRQYQESFDVHFSLVASGQTRMLRDNNAMLAAQCVIVLIEHVRRMRKAEVEK